MSRLQVPGADINMDLRHAKSDNSLSSATTLFSTVTADPLVKRKDTITYPEGGIKAWLVVFGSWCALFSSLGIMNTMGAFHEHISTHQLAAYKIGTVGWIFSLYAFLTFGVSLFVGPVFDKYGPRWLILAGGVAVTASTALIGVSRGMRRFRNMLFLLSYSYRILAFHSQLLCAGRSWCCSPILALYCNCRPLLRSTKRSCYRYCSNRRRIWRCCVSIYTAEAHPTNRLQLVNRSSCCGLVCSLPLCKSFHQRTSTTCCQCYT